MKTKTLKFPEGFLWGAAMSAHQVEGGNKNDWTEWESKNAKRLAREAKHKWADWQQKKFPEMFDPKNYISGKACDHYNRYEEDLDIAKSLGLNAFRISIEWSRIEPREGKFSASEIEHYRKVIKAVRVRGMEPFVTLWHYTLPIWFSRKGGWTSEKSSHYFSRYARKLAGEYKESVRFWITYNEPLLITAGGYIKGYRPPQKKNLFLARKVIKNLEIAHKQSYCAIHEIKTDAKVGMSEWLNFFDDRKAVVRTGIFSKIAKHFANEYLIRKIQNHLDFIGAQHYMRIPFSFQSRIHDEYYPLSDMGWQIVPEGMYAVLTDLKKYNLPIYITENGIADSADQKRSKFIKENLRCVHKAMRSGVDVRGYFYWSLIDNFEWHNGFWPRFGLVEVDYKTMKRKIRSSAREYAKICRSNELII